MLSNLINESTQNISKNEKDGSNSMPYEDNSIAVDKKSSRLWKCNLDAFLNNPGRLYLLFNNRLERCGYFLIFMNFLNS